MGQQQSAFFTEQAKTELLGQPVKDVLLLNRPLVTVSPTHTLKDALTIFRLKNISCVPVIKSKTEFKLMDVVDIVNRTFTDVPHHEYLSHLQVTFISNSYAKLGSQIFSENTAEIMNVPCQDLADFSKNNPTLTIPSTTSVGDVIEAMMKARCHRMVLVDEQGQIEQLVTQSSLVEFAMLNLDRLHPNPDATLSRLAFLGTSPVLACEEEKSVIHVLAEMQEDGVTAVPVVNRHLIMSGVMTVRHLKILSSANVTDVFLPVKELLKRHEASFMAGNWDMTLRDLFRVMVVNLFHHLFFLNEKGKPTNVITLTDMLAFLFQASPVLRPKKSLGRMTD
ncbi:hypothetical protein DFS34DRAFT_597273 [Phlyctochytrium arcticum]|nr:hypothetical protein DFS34DRAFT_597273 [Phlyctochytrium arcticum]